MAHPNPHDYNAIRNAISLYCIALDTKDWTLLEKVFTRHVVARYPFNDDAILGVDALSKRIQQREKVAFEEAEKAYSINRLKPVTTQHALTTQHLLITPSSSSPTAKATTYFTGVHVGRGKWEGQQVTAYGKYVDELECVGGDAPEMEAGASGTWKISKRTVTFFGRVGEEGVMTGEE